MDTHNQIIDKISSLKEKYPSFRQKPDYYIFSALCVEVHFYKNPENILNENDFEKIIVDGCNDGGADILLSDPNSEDCDLVIGQSKFYEKISKDEVINALNKMKSFYDNMKAGHYEQVNSKVQSRFLTLNAETGEESKIHFVFYTSAPAPKKFDAENIKKDFLVQFQNTNAVEVSILFSADIVKEIETAQAIKQVVERGKILIDETENYLLYGENAAIVNVSAFSIKELYAKHNISLLAQNLRYHVSGGTIDRDIKITIKEKPETFWLKNNGITIICDDFRIDGREVHLTNFSIVNGGQTVYLLHQSKFLDRNRDFFLTCKIIKIEGKTEEEKNNFTLEIAKATNSQKPIKPADLRANASEQKSFAAAMREIGIFYETKRGEKIPDPFKTASYLHTKLLEVGKLYLAAIFQLPCKSRNKPSEVYADKYYNNIFNVKTQKQVAQISKELLYIDYYFTTIFLPKFDTEIKNKPNAFVISPFAHSARTICIAFTALMARYYQGNIKDEDINLLGSSDSKIYDKLRDLGNIKNLLPLKLGTDSYNATLDKLFKEIIVRGNKAYNDKRKHNPSLTAGNFLKNDTNYYEILKDDWITLSDRIFEILGYKK